MAKAMASGSATTPTTRPAPRSPRNWRREYPSRRTVMSFGWKRAGMPGRRIGKAPAHRAGVSGSAAGPATSTAGSGAGHHELAIHHSRPARPIGQLGVQGPLERGHLGDLEFAFRAGRDEIVGSEEQQQRVPGDRAEGRGFARREPRGHDSKDLEVGPVDPAPGELEHHLYPRRAGDI